MENALLNRHLFGWVKNCTLSFIGRFVHLPWLGVLSIFPCLTFCPSLYGWTFCLTFRLYLDDLSFKNIRETTIYERGNLSKIVMNFILFLQLEVRQRRPEEPQPPLVDPPRITANIGQPARFRCWVPGNPNAQLTWSPLRGGTLPNGAVDRGGHLIFQSVAAEHEGQYICSYYHPESGRTLKSPPVELDVQEREFEKLLL